MGYQPSEVAVLVIALVAGVCVLGQREWLQRWRFAQTAILWFTLQLMAWCCSVLEGFANSDVLNFLEHIFYASAAIVALFACQHLLQHARKGDVE